VPGRPAPWQELAAAGREGIGLGDLVQALRVAGRDLATSEPPEPLDELSGAAAEVTGALRNSAVLVAAYESDGEARIVLTRRARHLRSHRGQVSLPGGRVEPGEEPLDAAMREAREEVGIDPAAVRPVAWLRPLVTFASGSIIRPFVGALDAPPVLRAQPAEVERAFDVSLRELLADGTFHEERWRRTTPRLAGGEAATFPIFFFEAGGETIWGATARILTELCCLAVGVPLR